MDAPGRRRARTLRRALFALGLMLAIAAQNALAAAPKAITDPADGITPVGATLHGRVNPNGQATAAWFQYGTTKSYGKRTAAQSAGLQPGLIAISAPVSGLKSNTTYHFRAVAESKDGKRYGSDRTFKTSKPTTTPVFFPNPVPYGRPVVVVGQLIGTGSSGAQVSLFGHPFPYTSPFVQYGNTVLASSKGNYTFVLASALSNTIFEVRAKTTPAFTSAQQQLHVTSTISLHTPARVKRKQRVHFWGIVQPAQNGVVVEIQRLEKDGSWSLFTRTTLKPRSSGGSRYTTRKRLWHSRTFRAVVLSPGGAVDGGFTRGAQFVRVR